MTFANRLRCEPTLELRACEPFDVWSRDAVHPTLADGRRDVDALHRLAVLPTRRPRALDRQAAAQFVSDLVDGRVAAPRPRAAGEEPSPRRNPRSA